MKTSMLALALAAGIGAAGTNAAVAMDQEFNMLTGAVYHALKAEGFDVTNIDKLSLAEIAQIKNLLSEDQMDSNARLKINTMLED